MKSLAPCPRLRGAAHGGRARSPPLWRCWPRRARRTTGAGWSTRRRSSGRRPRRSSRSPSPPRPRDIEYQLHYRRAVFNASQNYMTKGRALADQGDYIGAYNAFRQAYGLDPVNELAAQRDGSHAPAPAREGGRQRRRRGRTARRAPCPAPIARPNGAARRPLPPDAAARRGRPRASSSSRTSSRTATSKASSASWPTS